MNKIPLYDNNDSLLFSIFPPYIYTLELINLLFFLSNVFKKRCDFFLCESK
jgi:hypothetical protein